MMTHCFLTALHPNRDQNPDFTHIKHLVELLYDSLLNARLKPNTTYLASNTTIIAPGSGWTWIPSRPAYDPWETPDRSSTATSSKTPNATVPPRPKAAPPQPAAPPEPVVAPPQTTSAAVPSQQLTSVLHQSRNFPKLDTPTQPDSDIWLIDHNGVTYHKNYIHYKVTIKCRLCNSIYTTEWGHGQAPYDEMKARGWSQGRDRSGNWTWQQARCPNYGDCIRA